MSDDDDDQSFHLEDDSSEEEAEEAPQQLTKKRQHSKRATSTSQAGKKPPPKTKVKKSETIVHVGDNSMGEESPDSIKKATKPKKEKRASKKRSPLIEEEERPSYDIVLPSNLGNNGECTVLVQIDPEDAVGLDFVGAVGAIGRMETDEEGGTKRIDCLLCC